MENDRHSRAIIGLLTNCQLYTQSHQLWPNHLLALNSHLRATIPITA
jgi:hypothetical protein